MFRGGIAVLMSARAARPMLVAHSLRIFFRTVIVFCSSGIMLMTRRTARAVLMVHFLMTCLPFAHVPGRCAGTANQVGSD